MSARDEKNRLTGDGVRNGLVRGALGQGDIELNREKAIEWHCMCLLSLI